MMNSSTEALLGRLKGVKKQNDHHWMALCPAHADRNPSLSVSDAANRGTVIYCFAGCDNADVVRAVDMSLADLMPEAKPTVNGSARRPSAGSPPPSSSSAQDRTVATYSYVDERSELLYQVLRKDPKAFPQRRPDGKGGWTWGLGNVRRVLYRLPNVLKAIEDGRVVYLCEGEKDCDNLAKIGLTATTNSGGSKAPWLESFSEMLRGADVIVIPDNDEPGILHAETAADALLETASVVRWLKLPGVGDKGDVSDWLEAGGTREELDRLTLQAPTWDRIKADRSSRFTASELMGMDLPEPQWVVPGLLTTGLFFLAGRPKMGKSWMVLEICLAVAGGGAALGKYRVEKGEVLYLALEDHKRRLQDRIAQLWQNAPIPSGLTFDLKWPRFGEGGEEQLAEWLRCHPQTRLVVIDTFEKARRRPKQNGSVYSDDYTAAAEVQELALKYGVAIMVVHHTRKAAADDVMDEVSGSTGLTGSADGIWVLKRPRGESEAVLHITGRDVEEQELAVKIDTLIGSWSIVGEAKEVRQSKERADIIRVLKEAGTEMGAREVAAVLGKPENNIRQLMFKLADEKLIVRRERGKYAAHS